MIYQDPSGFSGLKLFSSRIHEKFLFYNQFQDVFHTPISFFHTSSFIPCNRKFLTSRILYVVPSTKKKKNNLVNVFIFM